VTLHVLTYSLTRERKPAQGFYKEFVTWKALNHPNVLPLLGVMVTENRFAMVSEWMIHGNINQFVTAHRDANRFELVSSPSELLRSPFVIDCYMAPTVERRCEGFARSGDDPRGSQGGASQKTALSSFPLTIHLLAQYPG